MSGALSTPSVMGRKFEVNAGGYPSAPKAEVLEERGIGEGLGRALGSPFTGNSAAFQKVTSVPHLPEMLEKTLMLGKIEGRRRRG